MTLSRLRDMYTSCHVSMSCIALVRFCITQHSES